MKNYLVFILCGLSLSAAHAVGEENYLTHLAKNPLKKDEAKALTQHIPKDILDNLILPRLDGKSLGNFAQACKNFNKIKQDFQIKRYVDMLLDQIAIDEQELSIINQQIILSKRMEEAQKNFLEEAKKLNFLSVKANSLQERLILQTMEFMISLQNINFMHQGKMLKQEDKIKKLDFKTALYHLLSQRSDFYVTERQKQNLIEEYKRMAQNPSGYVFYGENDWETEISKANTIVLAKNQINKNSLDKLKPHFEKNPSLKLLINMDLVANSPEKSNPHSENVLSLQSLQDIDFIKHLIITDTNGHITRIPEKFQLKHLESLELYLPKLIKIYSFFMLDCKSLQNFMLNAPELKIIESSFIRDCTSLKSIKFLGKPKINAIGGGFLEGSRLSKYEIAKIKNELMPSKSVCIIQ